MGVFLKLAVMIFQSPSKFTTALANVFSLGPNFYSNIKSFFFRVAHIVMARTAFRLCGTVRKFSLWHGISVFVVSRFLGSRPAALPAMRCASGYHLFLSSDAGRIEKNTFTKQWADFYFQSDLISHT